MFTRYLVGIALSAAIGGPALAQTDTEYYVVQDATSQTCTVVDKRPEPSAKNVVQVGSTVFKSREEAEAGMKTIKVCASN